jgi:hypothetical protein
LIPLIWIISLSLKNPDSIGDGSFLPTHPRDALGVAHSRLDHNRSQRDPPPGDPGISSQRSHR